MEQGMQAQAMIDGRTKANSKAVIDTVISNPNLTQSEVAKIHGIDRSRVSQICTKYGIDKQELQDFKDNRADIFAHIQKIVTESLTVDDIKKAPVGTRALIACQFYDKERIERGQVTGQEIQINVIQALSDRSKELHSMLSAVSNHHLSTDVRDCVVDNIGGVGQVPVIIDIADNKSYDNLGDNVSDTQAEPAQAQRRRGRPAKGR
jgi:predicted XRE-type DNA-binding protein